jgi:hypothetical protein
MPRCSLQKKPIKNCIINLFLSSGGSGSGIDARKTPNNDPTHNKKSLIETLRKKIQCKIKLGREGQNVCDDSGSGLDLV